MKGKEAVSSTVVREGLSVEVTFEQTLNEMREAKNVWGKGIPGRRNSEFKGPEMNRIPCVCRTRKGGGQRGQNLANPGENVTFAVHSQTWKPTRDSPHTYTGHTENQRPQLGTSAPRSSSKNAAVP